ncbi:MAG TPA: hypothetical protein VL119_00235 [Acidimicrobiia bacterium]|nr:hypothetical protein [Acidimicrobiia bacterium]
MALSAIVHVDGFPHDLIPVQLTLDAAAARAVVDDGGAIVSMHPHLHNGCAVHVTFGDGAEAVGTARVADGRLTAIDGFMYKHPG